jgi:hypothetical protein
MKIANNRVEIFVNFFLTKLKNNLIYAKVAHVVVLSMWTHCQ